MLSELVLKRLALQNPEVIASTIAKLMQGLALLFSPVVWFLSVSSRLLLILLQLDRVKDTTVTNEESQMVNNLMKLDDVRVSSIMVPRKEIYLLDALGPENRQRKTIQDSPYLQIIGCEDDVNQVLNLIGVPTVSSLSESIVSS